MKKMRVLVGSAALAVVCIATVAFATAFHVDATDEKTTADQTLSVSETTLVLPTVETLEADLMTADVRQVVGAIYGQDLSEAESYGSWDAEGLYRDVLDVAFITPTQQAPYIASVDPESKQIVAVETVADRANQPASANRQEYYAAAAKAFLASQLGVAEPGTCLCRLPAPNGVKTEQSVYVFFPGLCLYVEVSASSDHHFIGYRYFSSDDEMNTFLDTQSQAF